MIIVNFKKVSPEARLPIKAIHEGDDPLANAGFDLFLPANSEDIKLIPGEVVILDLMIQSEFSVGLVAILYERVSTGFKGISKLAGVIDSNYRGNWNVGLINNTNSVIEYPKDKAVAQVIFHEVPPITIRELDNLSQSVRGRGMGGSSGH